MLCSRVMCAALLLCRPAMALRSAAPRLPAAAVAARRGVSSMTAAATAAAPTLDERLVAEDPDLIKRSLRMRRASDETIAAVDRIGELTKERATFVESGNQARAERKALSPKIGALLKAGETSEAEALKDQVAVAAKLADDADARVEALEAERAALFNTLPNLLDARVEDGDDEDANEEVGSWGCEGELPSELKWHDELGAALGGIDLEAASKLSGARFSVLRGGLARMERVGHARGVEPRAPPSSRRPNCLARRRERAEASALRSLAQAGARQLFPFPSHAIPSRSCPIPTPSHPDPVPSQSHPRCPGRRWSTFSSTCTRGITGTPRSPCRTSSVRTPSRARASCPSSRRTSSS